MSEANGKEFYQTQSQEHVKQVVELDAQSRPYKVYTAALAHSVGQPCEVTTYGYENVNTTTIVARLEEQDTWTQAHQGIIDAL